MSSFTDNEASALVSYHFEASRLLGKHYWVVTSPFEYYVGKLGSEELIKVPAGFLTNGDSIPAVLWNLNTPWGSKGLATILHDYLYEHCQSVLRGIPIPISRVWVDTIFTESLQVLGMSRYKVILVKLAVSLARVVQFRKPQPPLSAKQALENIIRQNLKELGIFTISSVQEEIFIKTHPKLKEL